MVRWFCAVAGGVLLVQSGLWASSIFNLEFGTWPDLQSPNITCDSSLTERATSATLRVGSCTQAILGSPAYVTASATPLQALVDGAPMVFADGGGVAISGMAEYEGTLTAVGGAGAAWLSIGIEEGGANVSAGRLSVPSLGISAELSAFGEKRQYLVPITFGESIGYSLGVSHSVITGEPDIMQAYILIDELQVVDGDGLPLPGSQVVEGSGTLTVRPAALAPEPATAALLVLGGVFIVLGRFLKGRGV